jgi:hypothetical protein
VFSGCYLRRVGLGESGHQALEAMAATTCTNMPPSKLQIYDLKPPQVEVRPVPANELDQEIPAGISPPVLPSRGPRAEGRIGGRRSDVCQSALNSFQVTASKSFHLVSPISSVSYAV